MGDLVRGSDDARWVVIAVVIGLEVGLEESFVVALDCVFMALDCALTALDCVLTEETFDGETVSGVVANEIEVEDFGKVCDDIGSVQCNCKLL